MQVTGQVALITGVTGKVGRGMAEVFTRRGVRVVGTGRRADRGRQLEGAVRDEGGELTFVAGDVSKVDDCARAVQTVLASYGRLDILVNNAATVTGTPFTDSHLASESWWDEIVDTNLKGVFFMTRHALPSMIDRGSGSIVNIASAVALGVGPPRMAPYTASKAGLIALTKTMAVEYADRGLRFNVVVLGGAEGDNGYIVEDARSKALLGEDYVPAPFDERDRGLMTGADLAEIVLFLSSTEARHINGAAIAVDSGLSAGLGLAMAMGQRFSPTGRS